MKVLKCRMKICAFLCMTAVFACILDGSAKFAKAPAIEDVMDYWVTSNRLAKCEETEIGKGSVLTKYAKEGSKKQVWNLSVKDGRHSWPEESISGINVNELIIEFLETQG